MEAERRSSLLHHRIGCPEPAGTQQGAYRHDDRSARAGGTSRPPDRGTNRATECGLRRASRELSGPGPGLPPPQGCAGGRQRLSGLLAVRACRRRDRGAPGGLRRGRAAADRLRIGECGAARRRPCAVGHDSFGGHSTRLDLAPRAGHPSDGAGPGRGEGVAAAPRRSRDDAGRPEQAGYASAARRPGPRTSVCRRAWCR